MKPARMSIQQAIILYTAHSNNVNCHYTYSTILSRHTYGISRLGLRPVCSKSSLMAEHIASALLISSVKLPEVPRTTNTAYTPLCTIASVTRLTTLPALSEGTINTSSSPPHLITSSLRRNEAIQRALVSAIPKA